MSTYPVYARWLQESAPHNGGFPTGARIERKDTPGVEGTVVDVLQLGMGLIVQARWDGVVYEPNTVDPHPAEDLHLVAGSRSSAPRTAPAVQLDMLALLADGDS